MSTSAPSFNSFPVTGAPEEEKPKKKKKKSSSLREKEKQATREHDSSQSPVHASASLYYSDRKPDNLNIEYGKLYHGDIPKYFVFNQGRKILGLPIQVDSHRNLITFDDKSKSQRILSATPRRIMADGNSTKYQEVDGFLPLPSAHRPRSGNMVDPDPDSDSDSDSSISNPIRSDDELVYSTFHQETMKNLEHKVAADPSSIVDWLALLSHSLSNIHSKNADKARSEVTLSVLSRALSAHPTNSTSTLLRLKYLRAGEKVWNPDQYRAEWDNALKLGNIDIWMEWFEQQIREEKTGDSFDAVVDAALRIFSHLDNSEDAEIGKVRVFWRTAVAFQQAGYSERATAMFQAQAEFTFELPQTLYGLSLDTRLEAFEEFWDSEVPRMGELHSKGWAHWASREQELAPAPSASLIVNPESTELDPYRQWAEYESCADRVGWLPTRSTSSEADSDPYTMILFTDIRPLLFDLQTERARKAFRLAWLSTLGLPLPGFAASLSGCNWDDRWSYTHLTKPAFLDAVFPADTQQVNLTADAFAGVLVGRQKVYRKSFGPVKNWSWGCLRFFDPLFGSTGMWERLDAVDIDTGFVNRVFSSLRLGQGDTEWDLLSLAFEAAANVKSALKLSRSYLSAARESLPHWAAHAQMERMRGKLDDARKVYQSILIASAQPRQRSEESFLWWDWAEMEWLADQAEDALSVILRAAKVEGRGGVSFLRARRMLRDLSRDCSSWQEKEAWIKLGALLDLLTSHDIQAALSICEEQLAKMEFKEIAHESLTMSSLLFVYRYGSVLKNPMPPSMLREGVIRAMEHYPYNSVILGLFLEVERGQGVWGRIRATLGDSGENMKDVTRRMEEIWIAGWESGRWEAEIERTRIGLGAAIKHDRTRYSPLIWKIYIEFEIRAKQYNRAKELLWQALGECPRYKELYLLAFGPLRSVFKNKELNGLAEGMAERGIRIRKGLDEILEEWTIRQA